MSKRKRNEYQKKNDYKLQLMKAMVAVVDCASHVADSYKGSVDTEMEKFWDTIDLIEEMQEDFDNGNGKSWESYYAKRPMSSKL